MTTVAYVSRPDFIKNNNKIFDGKVKAVIIPKERAVDIDDEPDLEIAKMLMKKKQEKINVER
jgi:N-acylneuraminate cytidylyltransferase